MKILLFLKAPRPGKVKTRIAVSLGDKAACEIYKSLVEHQLKQLPDGTTVEIHYSPADAQAEMEAWLGDAYTFIPQCEGDLGDRLSYAVDLAFKASGPVFCIGADCPALRAHHFETAAMHLQNACDLVLGPTEDGGYYLLGLNQPCAALFKDIPWSSSTTLSCSLQKAHSQHLKVCLLEKLWDIDYEADWNRANNENLLCT